MHLGTVLQFKASARCHLVYQFTLYASILLSHSSGEDLCSNGTTLEARALGELAKSWRHRRDDAEGDDFLDKIVAIS